MLSRLIASGHSPGVRHRRAAIALTWGLLLLALALFWLLSGPAEAARAADDPPETAQVWTVCPAGPPDCTYSVIQDAVDAAAAGDVVKVATGVYTHMNGYGDWTQVVYLSKTVTIRGGYTAPDFSEPSDPEANPTTLDAHSSGRGVYITGSISPTIEGLRITRGRAYQGGGGVYVYGSHATLRGNIVFDNGAGMGGGIALYNSDAVLTENVVVSNYHTMSGLRFGAGLYLQDSNALLRGNTIISNTTILPGSYGGGLYLLRSDAMLHGNMISFGSAYRGGGLCLYDSAPTLVNNVIADSSADLGGGLIIMGGSSPHLLHNTIARNTGGLGYGVVLLGDGSTVWLTNTILVSHTVGIGVAAGNTAFLESTLWHGNGDDWSGDGAINHNNDYTGDPAFVDPDAGDYHIGPGSAARDRGVDAGVPLDIDGEPRPGGAGFDLGADEFYGPSLAVTKQASPDPVAAGAQLTYTLRVTNNGTVSLTTTINDVLPGQVTPSGVLTWTPPSILPGDTWTETVVVTVEVGYAGPLTNVVRVSTAEGATGAYTSTIHAEEAIAGLEASNDSPTALGEPTALTATVTAGSHVSYTWAFGDGGAGSGAEVSHTYPAVGVYTAVVTAGNSVSELTATTTVTIDEAIAGLEASNDSPTPLGEATALTATVAAGSNLGYTWAFGDDEFGSGAVVSYTYPAVGVYTAIITASNSVGELTATTTVTVDEAIAGLEATNDSPTPLGTPTTLTATLTAGSHVSYTWALGDGEAGSGALVAHTYPSVGVYTVVVTASNSVSELTATTTVTVDEAIAGLEASNDSPTALGEPTALTATVTAGVTSVVHTTLEDFFKGYVYHTGLTRYDDGEVQLLVVGIAGEWVVDTNVSGLVALYGHTAIHRDGHILVLGGRDASPQARNEVYYTTIEQDHDLADWQMTSPLPTAIYPNGIYWHASVVVNGRVYVLGGYDGSSTYDAVSFAPISADGSLGEWMTTTPLPEALRILRAAVVNGRIYAIGGRQSNNSPSDEVYFAEPNPDTGEIPAWTAATATLPNPTWGHMVAVSQDFLYLLGGTHPDLFISPLVSVTVPLANGDIIAWTGTTNMENNNYGGAAASYSGVLYTTGGSISNLYTPSGYVGAALINQDGSLGPWQNTSPIYPPRFWHAVVRSDDGWLYVVNGHDGNGPILNVNRGATSGVGAPYAPDGTYTSEIMDLGGEQTLAELSWNTTIADTSLMTVTMWYRTASSPGDWSDWFGPYPSSPEPGTVSTTLPLAGSAQLFQYQVYMSTTVPSMTPALNAVRLDFAGADPPSPGDVTYTWAFGDGEAGSGAVVSHTYPAVGFYTALVTASNSVSELTATTTVTIDEAIAGLEASNDSPTALGEPTALTATVAAGSHVTYTWAFGDGGVGSGAIVTHTYTDVGIYAAAVTASNSVGELTATTTVTVDEAIAGLEASNDSPTVLGEPTALTATITAGSNVTYTWAFGDGEVGSGATVVHTYPSAGVYTAVVTASNSVGLLTATATVEIAGPTIYIYLPLVLRE